MAAQPALSATRSSCSVLTPQGERDVHSGAPPRRGAGWGRRKGGTGRIPHGPLRGERLPGAHCPGSQL